MTEPPTVDDLSPHDQEEVAKFTIFLTQLAAAEAAGVPKDEAARSLYADLYEDAEVSRG